MLTYLFLHPSRSLFSLSFSFFFRGKRGGTNEGRNDEMKEGMMKRRKQERNDEMKEGKKEAAKETKERRKDSSAVQSARSLKPFPANPAEH